MINKIFTGGHNSSGTRVIQMLLKQTHNTYSDDITMDYELGFSRPGYTFGELVLRKIPVLLEGSQTLKEPFALKNPDFIFTIDRLKELFPKRKFILVVRNGVDQVLCHNRAMFHRHARYFGLPPINPNWSSFEYLISEMRFWNVIHQYALSQKYLDMIVRLEDLVYNTKRTVNNICKKLDIPYPDTSCIVKPDSMGRYQKEYVLPDTHGLRPETLKEVHYHPSMASALYDVGKESMKAFGYKYENISGHK